MCAGDCRLEYDRVTGCYLDPAHPDSPGSNATLYGIPTAPDVQSDTLTLPPPSPRSIDDVFRINDRSSAPAPDPYRSPEIAEWGEPLGAEVKRMLYPSAEEVAAARKAGDHAAMRRHEAAAQTVGHAF